MAEVVVDANVVHPPIPTPARYVVDLFVTKAALIYCWGTDIESDRVAKVLQAMIDPVTHVREGEKAGKKIEGALQDRWTKQWWDHQCLAIVSQYSLVLKLAGSHRRRERVRGGVGRCTRQRGKTVMVGRLTAIH